jgi:hypothetical protein
MLVIREAWGVSINGEIKWSKWQSIKLKKLKHGKSQKWFIVAGEEYDDEMSEF